jgi:hypothetical protein
MTFSVARPVAFKVPRARALSTPFALTVVIALSLTSATGGRHAVVLTGYQEAIAMIDCSAVSTRQPETSAKISKCAGHFFSPQKSPQNV